MHAVNPILQSSVKHRGRGVASDSDSSRHASAVQIPTSDCASSQVHSLDDDMLPGSTDLCPVAVCMLDRRMLVLGLCHAGAPAVLSWLGTRGSIRITVEQLPVR